MIERLRIALDALAGGDASAGTIAGGADAVRLALDCPQQELTRDQREALEELLDALDGSGDPAIARRAADVRALLTRSAR